MFGLIGEVSLHQDHRVAPGIFCAARDFAAQPIDCVRITLPRIASQ